MDIIVQSLSIGGCLAGAVVWICKAMIEPQKAIITRINLALDRWNDTMDRHQSAIHELELSIQRLSDKSGSNERRIERLEREVHEA